MEKADKPKILFVDDEENILKSLKRAVLQMEVEVYTANSAQEALSILQHEPIDVVVSDKSMPGMNGNELLEKVAQTWPEVVRIMLTAYTDLNDLIHAVNAGKIWGYLQKPWENKALVLTLEQAIQMRSILAERSLLRHTLNRYEGRKKRNFRRFIGESVAMQFVYSAIEQCAPSQASVFITGPSGAGKELAAQAIHELSSRKDKKLLAINCAAIPSELMESEIFGHIKGAFSGAVSNRDGAATLADGGTLFLDELGEMDMSLQAKILRFVQTGCFSRVGSSQVEKVDIRFISATNRDPLLAIAEQKLREDLYYRLNVISIDLPPLHEREKDAVKIAQFFLTRFSDIEDKVFVGFTGTAERLIERYSWPGNVRQLQNVIHSAVVMSEGPLVTEQTIALQLKLKPEQMQHILQQLPKQPVLGSTYQSDNFTAEKNGVALEVSAVTLSESSIRPLAEVERIAIEQAIDTCEGNVVKASNLLRVSPSTIYRKVQQWEE